MSDDPAPPVGTAPSTPSSSGPAQVSGRPGGASEERWPTDVPGTRFGDVRHVSEVDSTNALVLAAARAGAPEGLVVAADHQTAGRGRLDRRWEAPPGANLLVSILLRPRADQAGAFWYVTCVALSAADAIAELTGTTPACKWPNDLVVGDRKLAGLLAEAAAGPPALAGLVVGLGVNVCWPHHPEELPGATSLALEGAGRVDRGVLLGATLTHLEWWLRTLGAPGGAAPVAAAYRQRCATLGRAVVVELPRGRLEGTAVDVAADGSLLVDGGGRRTAVAVGDVVHVRPR